MKGIRQYRIKEIITNSIIETQEELVEALRGFRYAGDAGNRLS